MRHRSQAGHIEVGLLDVATKIGEDASDQFLASGMVNELRFECSENVNIRLDGQGILCLLGGVRFERLGSQLLCKIRKLQRTLGRGIDEELPVVELRASSLVCHRCIKENGVHDSFPPFDPSAVSMRHNRWASTKARAA